MGGKKQRVLLDSYNKILGDINYFDVERFKQLLGWIDGVMGYSAFTIMDWVVHLLNSTSCNEKVLTRVQQKIQC